MNLTQTAEEYRREALNDSISVCISDLHGFGTDAFLLSEFAAPRRRDLVCDLGTGCGIIPLLMARDYQPAKIYGIDIQEQAIRQFEASVKHSALSSKLIPILGDIRTLPPLPFGQFDLVTCNPPYKAENAGILSMTTPAQIARHEILCKITDVCAAAKKLLRYGGRLCLCQRPERLADVISAMRDNDIEPKLLRFAAKDAKSAPWLFLIEGKKSSKPFLKVLPTLYLHDGKTSRFAND